MYVEHHACIFFRYELGTVESVDNQTSYQVEFEDGSLCTDLPVSDIVRVSSYY